MKFVGKIGKMGRKRVFVAIPKSLWEEASEFEGKPLKITVEELIL